MHLFKPGAGLATAIAVGLAVAAVAAGQSGARMTSGAAVEANNAGVEYLNQGRLSESESSFKRAIRIWETVAGPDDPGLVRPLNNLTRAYLARGEHRAAARVCDRASRVARVSTINPADHAQLLLNQATLSEARNDLAGARAQLAESLRIWREVAGSQHPEIAVLLNNLGYLSLRSGRYVEAREELEESISLWASLGASFALNAVEPLLNLARVARATHRLEEAKSHLDRAYSVSRSTQPPHVRYAEVLEEYATLSRTAGDPAEARRWATALRDFTRQQASPHALTVDVDDLRGKRDKKK